MKKTTFSLAILVIFCLSLSAFAGEINHQRAVELRGGAAMYFMMDDPVDWANQFTPNLDKEMDFAPGFGLSVLYKSHDNFVWNIGFNHLFAAKTNFMIGSVEYEETATASEIFLAPGFIFWPESKMNLSISAGPSIVFASLDRIGPASSGSLSEFYGASGRNLGFLAMANLEFALKQDVALKIGGGYRNAFVDQMEFVEVNNGAEAKRQVMWTTGGGVETARSYELDFSGAFIDVGLRYYFNPKKIW